MNTKLFFVFLLAWIPCYLHAQNTSDSMANTPKKQVIFREKSKGEPEITDMTFAFVVGTKGWNLGFNYVKSLKKQSKVKVSNVYGISIGYYKHAQEVKSEGGYLGSGTIITGSKVKFGKINSLFPITLTYGQRRQIGVKAIYDGVEVVFEYKGGLLLGWMLPYQIYGSINGGDPERIKSYNNVTKSAYEDPGNIVKGYGALSQISSYKFIPGLRAGTQVIFNYSKKDTRVSAITVGMNVDLYSQSLPIFWTGNSSPIALQLTAGIEWGNRHVK